MGNYADDLRFMATMLDEDYHGCVKEVMDRMLRTIGYMLAGDLVTKDFDATIKPSNPCIPREFMVAPPTSAMVNHPLPEGIEGSREATMGQYPDSHAT